MSSLPDAHEPAWLAYLFDPHPAAVLGGWARRLRYFRFCRALSTPFERAGDQLQLALSCADESDATGLLRAWGLLMPLRSAVGIWPPGWVRLAGQAVYVGVRARPSWQLSLIMTDETSTYEVSEAAVTAAEVVEAWLAPWAGRVADPPRPDRSCVCPPLYPELWATDDAAPGRP